MNPELILDMQKRITNLEESQVDLQKVIAAFKIDNQIFLKAETVIKPGVACKVAYNTNGIITGVDKLSQSDIPQLGIEKITGLRKLVDDKASSSDITKLTNALKTILRKGDVNTSGCKVNVDEKGLVISTSDLNVGDIPRLPISKIEGLQEQIDLIRTSEKELSTTSHETFVNAGSGCKVYFDEHGHITRAVGLGIEDIPNEILSKLNVLESKIPTLATQKSVTALSKSIMTKLDANAPVAPGVYTKVTIDSKGLVTFGDKIDSTDLPEIKPENITGLIQILNNKADQDDLIETNVSLATLISSIDKIGDVQKLRSIINGKADMSEVRTLQKKVTELQDLLNTLLRSIPGDRIMEQLEIMTNDISTLTGRLSVLEQLTGAMSEKYRQE